MQLMMYIGNDLIEAIPVNTGLISVPGYLGGFKRQLKQKYQAVLQETAQQPEFLIINLAPTTAKPAHTPLYTTTAPGVYCP